MHFTESSQKCKLSTGGTLQSDLLCKHHSMVVVDAVG